MMRSNQKLRELFTLPPIQESASTALATPIVPKQEVVTGDHEVDAVLWLQSLVKTGNPVMIEKALELAGRIATPMKTLEQRYSKFLARTYPGNVFAVLFATMDFGDLQKIGQRAVEKASRRHEALSRFGSIDAIFDDTPAEKACKKALRGLKRKDFMGYDDAQVAERFAKHPALAPATIDDCLYAREFWNRLYWMREAVSDGYGDSSEQGHAHDWYCRDMLGHVAPRNAAEAIAALDHLEERDSTDWDTVRPIVRNLITRGWSRAEGEAA